MKILKLDSEKSNKYFKKLNKHLDIYRLGCYFDNSDRFHVSGIRDFKDLILIKISKPLMYIPFDKKSFKEAMKNIIVMEVK